MVKKLFFALISVIVLITILALPVYAIADPDTDPQIRSTYIYEDLLEDGDLGVLVDYYLDYAVLPTETVTEAYLVSFIDTDGVTQLGSAAPYAYEDDGYGRGVAWIYFSAADVTTLSIDVADILLYSVWLVGNPTVPSGWAGDPPKTVAPIDYWQTTGDATVLLALRVLYLGGQLETAWTVDMVEETSLGTRLTTIGESYFMNAIANLRTMAPGAFSAGSLSPTYEIPDYTTEFGAVMTDGTGTVAGSPITLVEGANTVNVTAAGTFTIVVTKGTEGTVVSNTGTVTGSPVTLASGRTNTITVPVAGEGNLIVTVNLVNTGTAIWDVTLGTGFDLTTPAASFGMSRLMFSGLVWLIVTIVICASVFGVGEKMSARYYAQDAGGKGALLVFDICIIIGAVLGMLSVLVAALLFIGFGAVTGYVLLYRQSNF